jgi:hypothetical protein
MEVTDRAIDMTVETQPNRVHMASIFSRPSTLGLAPVHLRCPKCDAEQPPGEVCVACGIVFAKYEQARRQAPRARRPVTTFSRRDRFPYRLVTQLLQLVFLASLGLALWSHWKKDQFPPPSFYDAARLEAPLQTPTESSSFQIEAQGIRYTIEPLFEYQLDGVVVSLHDSDVFWDIYHAKDWKDFINLRDLCVVWGENVASGVFREMQYRNSTWTCWISTQDAGTAQRFAWDQLSNNHLLAHDATLAAKIKSAEIGDQIRLEGKLARYSHAGGFQRGTSVTRTDTGNGACETIYVDAFRIVRKAHPGWRLVYRLSFALCLAALLGLVVMLFIAPVRAPRE